MYILDIDREGLSLSSRGLPSFSSSSSPSLLLLRHHFNLSQSPRPSPCSPLFLPQSPMPHVTRRLLILGLNAVSTSVVLSSSGSGWRRRGSELSTGLLPRDMLLLRSPTPIASNQDRRRIWSNHVDELFL